MHHGMVMDPAPPRRLLGRLLPKTRPHPTEPAMPGPGLVPGPIRRPAQRRLRLLCMIALPTGSGAPMRWPMRR
jgi:hypothetical protein